MGSGLTLGGCAVMSRLREHLARAITQKVDRHGIVVWEDPRREYADAAASVCPPNVHFVPLGESWYRLREELEEDVSGQSPPRLVVYQPTETPSEDPLAEVRAAGHVFRPKLATILREALQGQLTQARIEELARQGRTLGEVEAALTAGEGQGVRLPWALGTTDTFQLALRLLADDTDALLNTNALWDEARGVLQQAFGGDVSGEGETLRRTVFRHLLLIELEKASGTLPDELKGAAPRASADQRRRACELMAAWRADRHRLAAYRRRALEAQHDLGLAQVVGWSEGLREIDSFPELESLALKEVTRLMTTGEVAAAASLANLRLSRSLWVRGEVLESQTWASTWAAGAAVAGLGADLAGTPVPKGESVEGMLRWYAEQGWRVDRSHRRMEAALTEVPGYGILEEPIRETRRAYEEWLEALLERFTSAVEKEGLATGNLLRQASMHRELLSRTDGPVAYVVVDALRYEVGEELALALQTVASEVSVRPAVASAPTITLVGMAALLPGAEAGLQLELNGKDELQVLVDGTPVDGVEDRVDLLRAAHGQVEDIPLTEIFDQGEKELAGRIGSARLVLVRSQEIDEALESDKTAAGWRYVKELKSLIARAVARLGQAGVPRVVIGSDHGFLILSRRLGPERVIDGPGGRGELHRRCFVGRGGSAPRSALRLPLAGVGMQGELDLVVPRGLAVFAKGGARRFFHGGLSPQELLIPVLDVRTKPHSATHPVEIVVEVVGGKVTTGIFSATVELQRNLFTERVQARLVARRAADGAGVARVRAGDSYDEPSGVMTLEAGRTHILTFQVVENLGKGDQIALHLLDAESDRILARSKEVKVSTEVRVEEELE